MSTAYFKNRRRRLVDKSPYCHWCNRPVFEYPHVRGRKVPDDAATVDHLVSRYWGKRPNVFGRQKTLVLACFQCNGLRSKQETASISKWRLWFRAKSFPGRLSFINRFLKGFNRK